MVITNVFSDKNEIETHNMHSVIWICICLIKLLPWIQNLSKSQSGTEMMTTFNVVCLLQSAELLSQITVSLLSQTEPNMPATSAPQQQQRQQQQGPLHVFYCFSALICFL